MDSSEVDPNQMTADMLEKFKRLLEKEEKQKEAQRLYMRRMRQEKKEEINKYKRELYHRKKAEAEKAQEVRLG